MDQQGNPVCSEMWPGNASDGKSLVPIVERLKTRFPVGQVCIVADRGMIGADTLQQIRERKWQYSLGVRMRSSRKEVMGRAGRYQEVYPHARTRKLPRP
jgi:transposase